MDRRLFLTASAALALAAPARAQTPDQPFMGLIDAPATATLWFDFQCPACKQFWRQMLPRLGADYIKPGKLKLLLCDFSFLGKDSVTAAVVGRAVWHGFPQSYFAWSSAMFGAQDRENGGFGDEASVAKLTLSLPGIDERKFTADFNANLKTYMAEVRADFDAARRAGVRGTPTFGIGGKLDFVDARYGKLAARIDAALAG